MSDTTWHQALARTHRTAFGRIAKLLGNTELDDPFWEELETVLVQADVGLATARRIIEELRQVSDRDGLRKAEQVRSVLLSNLTQSLIQPPSPLPATGLRVTLLVGVNGSGKTTSAAKLAHWYQSRGQSVLIAAADTYRAAAAEQLSIWGDRLGVPVVSGTPKTDPGAVAYEACQAAIAQAIQQLIIDTSGRMHTDHNLMDELGKISRVCGKAVAGAPHTTLLVLDATTGQNGLAQAKAFLDAVRLDGAILAKLDSSARGGIAFAIQDALGLPVVFAGTGEALPDFEAFDRTAFVQGLLGDLKEPIHN